MTPGRWPTRSAPKLPVVFVVDHEPTSLDVLLSGLSRRFGNDFVVRGETSPALALDAPRELAAANRPVAILLVDDAASAVFARAHELHPAAKRVLLVDRDYTSTSPNPPRRALCEPGLQGRGELAWLVSGVRC